MSLYPSRATWTSQIWPHDEIPDNASCRFEDSLVELVREVVWPEADRRIERNPRKTGLCTQAAQWGDEFSSEGLPSTDDESLLGCLFGKYQIEEGLEGG